MIADGQRCVISASVHPLKNDTRISVVNPANETYSYERYFMSCSFYLDITILEGLRSVCFLYLYLNSSPLANPYLSNHS